MKPVTLSRRLIKIAIVIAISLSTLSSSTVFGSAEPITGRAALLASLHPHPVFTGLSDSLLHGDEGAGVSCSLHVLYTAVMLRTGRQFDQDEFMAFRRWATDQNLFFPDPSKSGRNVDLDALAKRLPEFFGPLTEALEYRLSVATDSWAESTAAAIESGHSVLAMESRGNGEYTEADHVVTLVEAIRGRGGEVVSFVVADPNSYRFWEPLNVVTVSELEGRLARPRELPEQLSAIAVSTTKYVLRGSNVRMGLIGKDEQTAEW